MAGRSYTASAGPAPPVGSRHPTEVVPTPTVLLMRHAKSDRPAGVADVDRPLADRGRSDAAAVGAMLAGLDPRPSVAITSPARRAAETARITIDAAGWDLVPTVDPDLYYGGVDDVLAAVRAARAETCLVVGHEPTWSATVAALSGASVHMVTAAVAAIEVPAGAERGRGALLWMLIPRLLGGGPE
jgi:phosphohistidine phosphatase